MSGLLLGTVVCGPRLALGLTFNGFRVSSQPVGSWPETGFAEKTETDHKPTSRPEYFRFVRHPPTNSAARISTSEEVG